MLRWWGLLARLVPGGVWLFAGLLKLPHPDASVTPVRAYQLLPTEAAQWVGYALPAIEVAVGLLLILGVFTRWAAVVSSVLLVAFIIGIASVWARGISINCGCFGDGGVDPDAISKYPWEIARDVALLAASMLLVWRPVTALSLDSILFRTHERATHGEEED